jgi:hypothetical protein
MLPLLVDTFTGVNGLFTLEFAVSNIGLFTLKSIQHILLPVVGLIILGDITILFYTTIKQASLLYVFP